MILTFILTPKLYKTVLGLLSAVVVLTVVCEERKLSVDDKLFYSYSIALPCNLLLAEVFAGNSLSLHVH